MLSTVDLESLIAVKRLEIEKEKTALGLTPPQLDTTDKENATAKPKKQVRVEECRVLRENNDTAENEKERDNITSHRLEDNVPAGLERYIRRYIGLPVMLKAGEYSPNNPLIRGERSSGDALFGLGEYDRRRHTLRKLRQQQYREYLDQQAKKKQQDKEQAEKEQREREERERRREEELRERERQREELERERREERRRASVCHVPTVASSGTNYSFKNKVDTGVQACDGRPLSVAVQTDDTDMYLLSPSPPKTRAERELSPRTVGDLDERPLRPAAWARASDRRRSYGDFDERTPPAAKQPRREVKYKPSIFDADAIQMRNLQAEKEAAARRQFYQQELKSQILEQQRIREERKSREKMLEQAEMRRLEEQLRLLRVAQEQEVGKQREITVATTENATDYDRRRTILQKEIDREHQKLLRTTSQPSHTITRRNVVTSSSDTLNPNRYYFEDTSRENRVQPFSTNIPENSIFSPNYDVDSYLRRNLNPTKESLLSNRMDPSSYKLDIDNIGNKSEPERNIVVEALIHERPKEKAKRYEPSFLRNLHEIDETPIPVLRHSPTNLNANEEKREGVSQGMQIVEDKWKVPAVQKNILKSLPNDEGKNMNILTQLGSIRRQLQLEQLRLDNILPIDHV